MCILYMYIHIHIFTYIFLEYIYRRQFKIWEDFWLHSLHPVYFGRSATHMEKKSTNIDSKALLLFPTSSHDRRDGIYTCIYTYINV
jgi:hypothetical protein